MIVTDRIRAGNSLPWDHGVEEKDRRGHHFLSGAIYFIAERLHSTYDPCRVSNVSANEHIAKGHNLRHSPGFIEPPKYCREWCFVKLARISLYHLLLLLLPLLSLLCRQDSRWKSLPHDRLTTKQDLKGISRKEERVNASGIVTRKKVPFTEETEEVYNS